MQDDNAYSEPWHSHNSFFKHFQGYLGMFRNIDAYSATFTVAQREGKVETSPAPFEAKKSVLIL